MEYTTKLRLKWALPVPFYGFGFFGSDPNADITVPFVPVILVVISADGLITFGGCVSVVALGAG